MDTELHVGREMDAAVAKALGYEYIAIPGKLPYWQRGQEIMVDLRCYSQTISGAFTALDAVMAKHPYWTWRLACNTFYNDTPMPVRLYCLHIDDELHQVCADSKVYCDTPAEAISRCILALEAT